MSEIGELLNCGTRLEWRAWLKANHETAEEIWLVYHKRGSGTPFVPYEEAAEEAICFGWVDGIYKGLDGGSRAQRWTPRQPDSFVSELNKARARKMMHKRKMTKVGRAAIDLDAWLDPGPLEVPPFIQKALEEANAWKIFCGFPEDYRRLKVGWIVEGSRIRGEAKKRLTYLVEKTSRGEKYGTIP